MRIKNAPLGQVKAGPDDGLKDGEFIVYPSTFTREPDAYGDIVAKGAFLDSIQKWKDSGNVLPGLWGHRDDDPDFYVAEAIEMTEDEHGWRVHGRFDMDSPKGAHTYRLVRDRKVKELSFAYDVVDEGGVELEDGRKANELRKLNVHEFSFVPRGANPDTSILAVKALAEAAAIEVKGGLQLKSTEIDSLRRAQEVIGAVIAAAGDGKDQEKSSDGEDGADPASASAPADDALAAEVLELELQLSA